MTPPHTRPPVGRVAGLRMAASGTAHIRDRSCATWMTSCRGRGEPGADRGAPLPENSGAATRRLGIMTHDSDQGGTVSEGGSGSLNEETIRGGADAVPETPDTNDSGPDDATAEDKHHDEDGDAATDRGRQSTVEDQGR